MMKCKLEENKRIKLELNKMIDESNQICRILDKDDVNVEFINRIGKKSHLKSPNIKKKNLLPNLIYHQGQLNDNNIIEKNDTKKSKMNFKAIFAPLTKNNTFNGDKLFNHYISNNSPPNLDENKKHNDFHANFFKQMKGVDNDKIINGLLISQKFEGPNIKIKKIDEEKKNDIKNKLNLIVPEIMQKKNLLMKRIPLYIKKYKKNYDYVNNQIILDEMNEKRYVKYDDPFLYSLNVYPSNEILPNYNNLLFKYQKSKIRDYFYRHTVTSFHSNNNNNAMNANKTSSMFKKAIHQVFI